MRRTPGLGQLWAWFRKSGKISAIRKVAKVQFPTLISAVRRGEVVFKNFLEPLWAFIESCDTALKHQKSRRYIRRLLKEKGEILVELGAGGKKGECGWVTVDIVENCDIFWDLRKGMPFPDEAIMKIYSSHFFEHLSYPEGQIFLDECRRTLAPGGTFSICVPNAKLYVRTYLNDDPQLKKQLSGYYKYAFNNTTKIDYLNYIAYMDGQHKYMFDEENLVYILKAKGFKNVHLRPFDPSLDQKERDFESIYAQGEK